MSATTFTITESDRVAKVEINASGYQMYRDVVANFCNFDLHKVYVELNEKIQPGFYLVPEDDILRVKYNEEYLDQDGILNFLVLNSSGAPITSLSAEDVIYGDNRHDINVSSLSSGFYSLMVENEKGDKWYLRFKVQ